MLLVGLAPSGPLAADSKPRLAIILLDETKYDGAVRLQAVEVNRFLKTLGTLFPELEVDVGPAPRGPADYRLELRSMLSTETYLELEAGYEGVSQAIPKGGGAFTEDCSDADEADGECTRSSMEQRAELAVGDLLNNTVLHWEKGIYRLVEVRRCEDLPPIGVALQVSPTSTVDAYKEPSDRFDYSARVLVSVFESPPYPLERHLVLRRKDRLGNAFAFSRLQDPEEHLGDLCRLDEHWVLLHRFQRRELPTLSGRARPDQPRIAINGAQTSRQEER